MRKIEKWVENASPKLEFFVVVFAAFGYFSVGSLFSLLFESRKVLITGEDIIFVLVYEITVFLAVSWFLKKRGWTLAQFGVLPNWKSTVMGVGLILVVYFMYALTWISLTLLFPEIQTISQSKVISTLNINLWQVIFASIINPIFEEIFVCGYIIHFFKKLNKCWIAVIISTSIRTLYHLYQPVQGIIAIISIGLVFGLFYARTNRLWAVIAAHSFFDLFGFLRLLNS